MNGYFDYNASSPLRPQVAAACSRLTTSLIGNPSSMHGAGRAVRMALDDARTELAMLLSVHPSELYFTSGATESNNTVLRGTTAADPTLRVAVAATEHASIRTPAETLRANGTTVTQLSVNEDGQLCLEELQRFFSDSAETPCLLSVGAANGESGVICDFAAFQASLRSNNLLHVDATQAFTRIADCAPERADFISLSAHKLGGPTGIGALVVRKRALKRIKPLIEGGPQENNLRAGTENVAGIVGFAAAARHAAAQRGQETRRLVKMRERIDGAVYACAPQRVRISPENGLANTLTIALPGVSAEVLIAALDLEGFCISTGSACAAASPEPSPVMAAMGLPSALSRNVLRISLGWGTEAADVELFIAAFERVWRQASQASEGAISGKVSARTGAGA